MKLIVGLLIALGLTGCSYISTQQTLNDFANEHNYSSCFTVKDMDIWLKIGCIETSKSTTAYYYLIDQRTGQIIRTLVGHGDK